MSTLPIPITPSQRQRLTEDITKIIEEELGFLNDQEVPDVYLECAKKIIAAFSVDLFEQPQKYYDPQGTRPDPLSSYPLKMSIAKE